MRVLHAEQEEPEAVRAVHAEDERTIRKVVVEDKIEQGYTEEPEGNREIFEDVKAR